MIYIVILSLDCRRLSASNEDVLVCDHLHTD